MCKDIQRLSEAPPFAWSRYALTVQNGPSCLRAEGRRLGAAAGHASERRLERIGDRRLPAAPSEPDHLAQLARSRDQSSQPEPRAAISSRWEQHLADRLEGAPLDIRVEMDSQSILHRTLWLFAGAFAAAVAVLALLIWFTMSKGGGEAPAWLASTHLPSCASD